MKTTIALLSAMALATTLTFGEPAAAPKKGPGGPGKGGHQGPEKVFNKLDTNTDGSLSLDEFKAGPLGKKDPEKAEKAFKKLDADNSGGVSLEEFKARPPHKGGKKGGPDKATPPPANP